MIKVCINPQCDQVAHNCKPQDNHCSNCDTRIIAIDEATYHKKFRFNFFQIDQQTGELYRPEVVVNNQLTMSF